VQKKEFLRNIVQKNVKDISTSRLSFFFNTKAHLVVHYSIYFDKTQVNKTVLCLPCFM